MVKKLAYTEEEVINMLSDDLKFVIDFVVNKDVYEEDYYDIVENVITLVVDKYREKAEVYPLANDRDGEWGVQFYLEGVTKEELVDLSEKLVYIGIWDAGGLGHDDGLYGVKVIMDDENISLNDYIEMKEDEEVEGTKKKADVEEWTDDKIEEVDEIQRILFEYVIGTGVDPSDWKLYYVNAGVGEERHIQDVENADLSDVQLALKGLAEIEGHADYKDIKDLYFDWLARVNKRSSKKTAQEEVFEFEAEESKRDTFNSLEDLINEIKTKKWHPADFIKVEGVPYRMVEYVFESVSEGKYQGYSKTVSYADEETLLFSEITINFEDETAEEYEPMVDWTQIFTPLNKESSIREGYLEGEEQNKIAKDFNRDVRKLKTKLRNKAKKKGLYENFGEEEYRWLDNKYSDYRYTNRGVSEGLSDFSDWCGDFDLSYIESSKKMAQGLYVDMGEPVDDEDVIGYDPTDLEVMKLADLDEEDLATKLRISTEAAEKLQELIYEVYFE